MKNISQSDNREEQEQIYFKREPVRACRQRTESLENLEKRLVDQVNAVGNLTEPD